MTIHLVYPHGEGMIAAPWSIGNHLAAGLRSAGYKVEQYDWQEVRTVYPEPGDILLGHPHPEPGFIFERSAKELHWSARIAMTPWGGLPLTVDMINRVRGRLEHIIAICGPYWADRLPPEWGDEVTTADMAVDSAHYPPVKQSFNGPCKRGVAYIGCSGDSKGTPWLEELIALCPDIRFGHFGAGHVSGAMHYGFADFRCNGMAKGMAQMFDFVICPGENDANPTVALESACWGLIPVCRETAGWDCFVKLPGSPEDAAAVLHAWQKKPGNELERESARCRDLVVNKYTWGRFVETVMSAL